MKTPEQAKGEAMPKATKTDTDIAREYRELEHQICSLDHMADILSDLLERSLKHAGVREPGEAYRILLSENEVERLGFAWNDVAWRATALRDAFYAIGNGECA